MGQTLSHGLPQVLDPWKLPFLQTNLEGTRDNEGHQLTDEEQERVKWLLLELVYLLDYLTCQVLAFLDSFETLLK